MYLPISAIPIGIVAISDPAGPVESWSNCIINRFQLEHQQIVEASPKSNHLVFRSVIDHHSLNKYINRRGSRISCIV
ncbi:MAG: hypothetical protein H6612_02610 [Ignavibacteriales bacterium]|nr:hypothetical protein [Ignavibacteriales bacterium]